MAIAFETRLAELQEAGTLPGGVYIATDASGRFLLLCDTHTPSYQPSLAIRIPQLA